MCITPVDRAVSETIRKGISILLARLPGAETDVILFDGQDLKHVGYVRLSEHIEDQYEVGHTRKEADKVGQEITE